MIGGDSRVLQGVTIREGKAFQTTGTFKEVNVIECEEDGDILVTWHSGATQTQSWVQGKANPINCKSVQIVSGTFSVSRD